ncbi:hypothetical protein T11_4359 [Trichinella zimbabwensis]|uniref:Uncharacterized protein n=1 Tax=Trichinella zimbabwensis TaxID=268475 RepID=A0A0V1H1L3_9BILA|nr:hypothetical protein T11_4359 [Trichinella zimbabwensis]
MFENYNHIQRTILAHRIKWKFITDRALWCGGCWERLIRTVKSMSMKQKQYRQYCQSELSSTNIHRRETRPESMLSPSHFFIGRIHST